VRQLGKVLEVALLRANMSGAPRIGVAELNPERREGDAPQETWQEATRRFQARLLQETLDEVQWSVPAAARQLDLARSHVYALISAFGLSRAE
jgi:Nif-specific regulatory protein